VTIVAHQVVAFGPNREARVLLHRYHGRTGQPLQASPLLWEASQVARLIHEKAVGGQPGAREMLVHLPGEQAIVVLASDGDIITVHEEVARAVFPTIAKNRASWGEASWQIPEEYHEASRPLSFDDWA
jgi:hypothetical protein